MIITAVLLLLGVMGCLLTGYMFGHGIGHEAGYAKAMKQNGWRRTLLGWYRETP
jgi:hypothetical protein